MNQKVNDLIMHADEGMGVAERSPQDEQLFRKQRLAAALRIFGKFGFDEGVAGHITVRDPIAPDTFWVNSMGRSFKMMRVSDLIRVDHDGNIVEGKVLNGAAFTIHSRIHEARPEVTAAAHAHSIYGKTWSCRTSSGSLTQDACAFYGDHALLDDYTGVVVDLDEGKRLADCLGQEGDHSQEPWTPYRGPIG